MKPPRNETYGQILKSSAIIGSSSVVTIILGAVRTKAMALMLGPSGVGLLGVYTSILELAKWVGIMGTSTSGAREIAEAVGNGDMDAFSRKVLTLRRTVFFLGILGALLLLVVCRPISRLSFGDDSHAASVAVLALAVFLSVVAAGQTAVVRGVRRMTDLARISIVGAFCGVLVSIPIVYLYRERGVVPSLVCIAAMGVVPSWWYSRKVKVQPVELTWSLYSREATKILKLGFVFLSIMLMSSGVAYLVRIIVVRSLGVEAAGLYQAAWAVGALYVMAILEMMGADFLPRLSAIASSNGECTRLVNEQIEVNMLMGGPGVLATLSLSPLVILLFYSTRFGAATEVLRWICLGMSLRIASWPMGYMLIAKNSSSLVFWSELLNRTVEVGLIWLGVRLFGLAGAGIGFFVSCALYWCLIYSIVSSKYGFCWSAANKRIGLAYGLLILTGFIAWFFLSGALVMAGGVVVTIVCAYCSLKVLCTMIPLERMPGPAQNLLRLLRIAPSTIATLNPSPTDIRG